MISQITIWSDDDRIPNDATLIKSVFKKLDYLDASKICVFPSFENNNLKYIAYIQVREWSDCDAAYNIIKAMKDGKKVRIYVAELEQLWNISETSDADLWSTYGGNKWTTAFEKVADPGYAEYEYERDCRLMQQRISAF